MAKTEKNIRALTDEFVCDHEHIAHQIFSDVVEMLAEQDADPKYLVENDKALAALMLIYSVDAVKRLHDARIKSES